MGVDGTSRASHQGGRHAFLAHGDVPLVILGLLEERSMHGYEMIKSLEERSGGLYKPSAGAIYPTLQMLEDQDFIESVPDGRKKVFSITAEGHEHLCAKAPGDSWRSILTPFTEDGERDGADIDEVVEMRRHIKGLFSLFLEASSLLAGDDVLEEEFDSIISTTTERLTDIIERSESGNV